MDRETVYSHDPLDIALRWKEMGAEMLHVVDLDGAVAGRPVNSGIIEKIISIGVDVQVGGGIRDMDRARYYLTTGACRVVLGTAAVADIKFVRSLCTEFSGRVVISLDARDGKVAVRGWTEVTERDPIEMAKSFEGMGIGAVVFTDISRDGTLKGPNIRSIKRFLESVKIPVIASGGISGIEDIRALLEIGDPGLEGVIVGKALYSGAVDLREAIALAKGR